MKNKFLSYVVILCLIVTSISLIPTKALYPQPRVDLYEYTINVTNNTDVYVEGSVSKAYGQYICVSENGSVPIAAGKVGNSGNRESFKIKIPAVYIKSGSNLFYVYSEAVKDKLEKSNPQEFKVNYDSGKRNQTITASNMSIVIGTAKKIGATASSGLPLTYKSSNSSIATIDMNGVVIGRQYGSTPIVISQQGDSRYNAVSKTVTVSVVKRSNSTKPASSNTYKIRFNGMGGKGNMPIQKVQINKSTKLYSNRFKRDGYQFVGWAIEKGKPNTKTTDVTKFKNVNMKHFQLGKVKYKNRAYVRNLAKKDKTITLYAVWKGNGPQAAVDWAKLIARDNRFIYHKQPKEPPFGCYFCKTNPKWNKGKTYVCMTFVSCSYAHGANKKAFWKSSKKCYPTYIDGESRVNKIKQRKNLKHIGKPSRSKLRPGDILIYKGNHVAMYVGKVKGKYKFIECNNVKKRKDQIAVKNFTAAKYRQYKTVFRLRK